MPELGDKDSAWRWAVGLLTLCWVGLVGACQEDGPQRPRPPRRSQLPASALSARAELERELGTGGTRPTPRPVPSSLLEFRRRHLELAPRRSPVARLAFGRNRIGQLTDDALVVRDLAHPEVGSTHRLQGPRQLVALADGGLLAVGRERLAVWSPGATRPKEYGRATLFPDSSVMADARRAERFWVYHPGTDKFYLYLLGGTTEGLVPFDQLLPIDGCDGRGFCGLPDGSFVCTTPTHLRHFWAEGKRLDLAWSNPDGLWRIVPAGRLDQFWVAREKSRLELYQLSIRAELVKTLEVDGRVLDVTARGPSIALVVVSHSPGQPRQWLVRVLDSEGHQRFEHPLSGDEDVSRDDWVAGVMEDRSVVLSRDASQVAVGGPRQLIVWDMGSKAQIYPK